MVGLNRQSAGSGERDRPVEAVCSTPLNEPCRGISQISRLVIWSQGPSFVGLGSGPVVWLLAAGGVTIRMETSLAASLYEPLILYMPN